MNRFEQFITLGCLWYGVSYFFLKNPQLLWAKKNKMKLPTKSGANGGQYTMAHRGGSREALENSLSSFQYSNQLGIDIIECDVQITKDDEVFVAHDDDFERLFKPETFNKDNNTMRKTDSNNLPQFKDELPLDFTNGEVYKRKSHECTTYTKLEDIFKSIPKDQMIHIDVKGEDTIHTVRKVVEIIGEYNRQSTTIVGSFSRQNVDLVRELDPLIPTFAEVQEVMKIMFGFFFGLLPYIEVQSDSICLPYITRAVKKTYIEEFKPTKMGIFFGYAELYFAVLGNMSFLNPVYTHLNQRGCLTSYWVINDDEDMDYVMRNMTANGIMTDRPKRLQERLQNYRDEQQHQSKQLLSKF